MGYLLTRHPQYPQWDNYSRDGLLRDALLKDHLTRTRALSNNSSTMNSAESTAQLGVVYAYCKYSRPVALAGRALHFSVGCGIYNFFHLLVLPLCLRLVRKCLHANFLVLATKQAVEDAPLILHTISQR